MSQATGTSSNPRRLRTLSVAIALILGFGIAFAMRPSRARPVPGVLGQLPPFELVDERGARFEMTSMLGHPSVVDFIFTRCASSCPRLTARMGELQDRLVRKKIPAQLVSFSVDPDNDTPAVLSEYAAQARADLSRWSFVTGSLHELEHAVVGGFKVSFERIARDAGAYDVVHGEWFVLVDGQARIRGYYPVESTADLDVIVEDIQHL
jgi:protein SCO1/2